MLWPHAVAWIRRSGRMRPATPGLPPLRVKRLLCAHSEFGLPAPQLRGRSVSFGRSPRAATSFNGDFPAPRRPGKPYT